jgi:hypothetical protein
MTPLPETFVTITDASKMVGISRQTMYNRYINKGVITVNRVNDEPKIDVSDLIRVFGNIKYLRQEDDENGHDVTNDNDSNDMELLNELKIKVALLEQENTLLKERIEDKDKHLADMRRGFELIEHSSGQKNGIWRRIFG